MIARTQRYRRMAGLLLAALVLLVAAPRATYAAAPVPWMADVAYDVYPLDTLDIYRPDGVYRDLPFVMFIHAGGWWNGDKKYLSAQDIAFFTDRGIAFVAINYRNITAAQEAHLFPPVLGPLGDARRALQFLRDHAGDFALDPSRAVLWGESAGAFDALWLGLVPDRANPASADPLLRTSTRVAAIAAQNAQTSLDPVQMRAWVGPQLRYGGQAFGLPEKDFDAFLARRDEFAGDIAKLSPAALVSSRSPPLFLLYDQPRTEGATDPMYFVHSPNFGEGFAAIARAKHVSVTLRIGEGAPAHAEMLRFLAAAALR